MTEYLGERLYRAAVAEIDGRGEGVPAQVESDLLADAAGFGNLFEVLVACTVRGHGKYEIASGKSLVPFYQFLGYFHKGNVARHTGLGASGYDPILAVEVHALDLVMGECLYINVAKSGEAPEEEHVTYEVGLFFQAQMFLLTFLNSLPRTFLMANHLIMSGSYQIPVRFSPVTTRNSVHSLT